jgi:hypothetical protein
VRFCLELSDQRISNNEQTIAWEYVSLHGKCACLHQGRPNMDPAVATAPFTRIKRTSFENYSSQEKPLMVSVPVQV